MSAPTLLWTGAEAGPTAAVRGDRGPAATPEACLGAPQAGARPPWPLRQLTDAAAEPHLPPGVAVIVVMHESRRYIARCLGALLASLPAWAEVVVVDNASTDGGPELVRRDFPGVTLVCEPLNRGYAGGINAGLAHTQAQLIAPLNADTEPLPGWLEALEAHLRHHPEVAAVTPMLIVDQDRGTINALGGAIHRSGMSFCNGLGGPVEAAPQRPFSVPGISGAAYLVRRPLLESLGGAPEFCFMGNDDVVLSWWLRLMGHDLCCVPEARVCHRYNLSLDAHKLYLVERNRWILLLTSLQRRTMLTRLPAHLGLEVMILGYCAVRGPSFVRAKARAALHALADPAELLKVRSQIQSVRRCSDRALMADLSRGLAWSQLFELLGRGRAREESL